MDKIIFLCTGNTCRSPMAEGLFRVQDGERRLSLEAGSAGLFTTDGICVTENAVQAAQELGADISGHTSHVLTAALIAEAKYLVCMTGAHYDRLLEQYPQHEGKIFMLSHEDVSDPFGGDLETYRICAVQIKEAIAALIERLERNG